MVMKKLETRKLGISLLCVALSLTLLSGCSTVTIEGGGNEDDVFQQPITVHGSMYGFTWDDSDDLVLAYKVNSKKKKRLLSISSLKAHTNYLNLLAGVFSFGLYYPQTFEYKLVSPERADDADEEEYIPGKRRKTSKKSGGK